MKQSDQNDLGRLLIISGPQAAGKTTIGHAVADRLERAVHIDGDLIQGLIVSGSVPMDLPPPVGALEQLHLRYLGALAVANIYRTAGFDAVVTDNLFEEEATDFLSSSLADDTAEHVYFVMLDPSIEAIWERYNQRAGGGYSDTITPEVLKLAVSRTLRLGLWLDNSEHTVDQTADEILRCLPQAKVARSDLPACPASADS